MFKLNHKPKFNVDKTLLPAWGIWAASMGDSIAIDGEIEPARFDLQHRHGRARLDRRMPRPTVRQRASMSLAMAPPTGAWFES